MASREQARATAYAGERGIDLAYGSYEELLADPGIEAVYISLPNSLHVEWSVRALRAGSTCSARSPSVAIRGGGARLRHRRGEGRILMEAFMYRHHPQTAGLRELVGDGAVGSLRLIRATFSFALGGGPSILLDPALDGGGLMDVGCYCVNAARLLAGEPPRGCSPNGGAAQRRRRGVRSDRCAFPATSLPSSTAGCGSPTVTSWRRSARRDRCSPTTHGTAGSPCSNCAAAPAASGSPSSGPIPTCSSSTTLDAAIRGEAEPLLGRADAVGQARAMDALLRSAAGRPAGRSVTGRLRCAQAVWGCFTEAM